MTHKSEIRDFVEENWDAIEADIAHMVSIPSVRDDEHASEVAPFGPEPRKALDEILKIAERLGFDVKPTDNYCAVADLAGKDDQDIAIVAHVDVVPAGPGWNTDPFKMEKREGWLLGRGVEDDKGPGIIALWAARWFIENNITPQHKIRFVFGTDEESGMGAVRKYVAENPQPDFMFTPDAEFPVICGEKGIVHGEVSFEIPKASPIKEIKGGVAKNAVAGEAYAIVERNSGNFTSSENIEVSNLDEEFVKIYAKGISGHASLPEGTINAIGVLVEYLFKSGVVAENDQQWMSFLQLLLSDSYGEALGLACEDDFLGKLTCVGGMISLKNGQCTQTIDIRYPSTTNLEKITAIIEESIKGFSGAFNPGHTENSHIVDPKDSKVKALMDSYTDVTGKAAEPIAIGGGTYAKRFEHSVAFGPCEMDTIKPEWAGGMHGPNEAINVEELKNAMVIYILALENLMELDLRVS